MPPGYDLPMPGKRKTSSERARKLRPRFDATTIGKEVEAARARLGIPVEDAAKAAGLSGRTHWYSKTDGTKPLRWEEVGQLAEEFHAPKGWPIVSWDEGLAWEAFLSRRD